MALQEGTGNKKLYVVGNYRFTGKLLGKGNFARVEEAVHTILNVRVAIKIMDINQIKEEYVIKNLCREAKLMAKLNHPCICALYQTMQRSDNVYYLVTELASGGDLCTFVKEQRGGKMEERPARIYARQFVSALAHMHQIGVVHRDLKMENVMLNSARTQIKIVDFGLSNHYSPNEPLKTHCGSPEYAAPELFVTGMTYGPEVDLWSLGIILYGMVVGQLPFVSNRNEQISSQERRKRLVAQINKGLGSAHKRALASFSSEFRNMVNRMLMADVPKRITIKELLVHPFITERNAKSIRANPIKKLEVKHQAGIVGDICELTHEPSEQVIHTIKREPFSRLGGMYNILAHRMALNRLSGDGVTKIQPIIEVETKLKVPQECLSKRSYNLRSQTASHGAPTISMQDKRNYSQQGSRFPITSQASTRLDSKRSYTPSMGIRPKTVQSRVSEKKLNYRDIKPAFVTKKSYSAGITPKTTRTSTISSPIAPVQQQQKLYEGDAEKLSQSDKKVVLALPHGLKINIKPEKSGEAARAQTALNRKQRSKSEKLPSEGPRPATTSLGANRKSLLATSQSESRAASSRAQMVAAREPRPFTRLLKLSKPLGSIQQSVEKTSMAYGDIAERNQMYQKSLKKPTIYDPIARSIAGYVSNNVPNISQFKK